MQDWNRLIRYVTDNECTWPREPTDKSDEWGIHQLDTPPHNQLLGPVFARGGPAGLVRVNNETVCQWGDIHRPDMTFSVTKTCLALTAGIAIDRGLIADIDAPVYKDVPGIGFDDPHNRQITWKHLLQFTSEWSGSCFGIPDQVDHYRQVSLQPGTTTNNKGEERKLCSPGSYWEYNDVRMNQFSLALMHVFKQTLPEIFRENIMQPVGASDNWKWHGYSNSFITIENQSMQSVPGGGHWGGGLVIAAHDQALIAQLLLNRGNWQGRQLVSQSFLNSMLTPCDIAPFYGFFIWLNTDNVISKAASSSSYFALGVGGQLVWHDPANDLIAVFRWLGDDAMEHAIELVMETISQQTT